MRSLVLLALLLVPLSAAALDCTPFQTWTCANQGYYDLLNGQPGEVLCGVDYTGWTFHVIEVTVTEPGLVAFSAVSAASSMNIVETAVILMDDCNAGSCLDSVQTLGMAQLAVCLDVGSHRFVVASNTTAPTAFMNTGIACFTCAEAVSYGYDCVLCQTVDDETTAWGSVKARFR